MRVTTACAILLASPLAWAQVESLVTPKLLRSQDLPVAVETNALQRQYDALAAIGPTKIKYSPRGPVAVVRADDSGPQLPALARDLAKGSDATDVVLPIVGDLLLARGSESLVVRMNAPLDKATRTLRLEQSIRGIPVIGGMVSIDYDDATMRIKVMAAHFVPDRDLPTQPKLSAREAELAVPAALKTAVEYKDSEIEIGDGTYLAYYANKAEAEPPRLVWVVQVTLNGSSEQILVDAASGAIAGRVQQSFSAWNPSFYNANGGHPNLPGGLGSAMGTNAVQNLVDSRDARDNLAEAADRIDDVLPFIGPWVTQNPKVVVKYVWQSLPGQVAYQSQYRRISGVDYMIFSPATTGANSWTKPRDIVDHEFGHGIAYQSFAWAGTTDPHTEIGATHEFFGDFYAVLLDETYSNRTWLDAATWRVGEGLFTSSSSLALRSLKQPRTDPNAIEHDRNWYPTRSLTITQDHDNATIPGHAFYLAVMGGRNEDWADPAVSDIQVTPLNVLPDVSAEMAALIFFRASVDSEMADAPIFSTLRDRAIANANEQFGTFGTGAVTTITNAFDAVGVCGSAAPLPPKMSLTSIGDLMCAGRFNPTWSLLPGVSRYYAEVAPQALGFSFSTPVTDVNGQTNHCLFQVSQPSIYRIRACNSCGCGPWSNTYALPFWSPCP